MNGINVSQLLMALQALGNFDTGAMIAALQAKTFQGDLVAAEDVAGLVSAFWPEAAYARDALLLVGLIAQLYEAGYLTSSAPPVDPEPWGGRKQDDR